MKKILFSDKFRLTQAVLEGRKTMTRRAVPEKLLKDALDYVERNARMDWDDEKEEAEAEAYVIRKAPFKVGEFVAVAQSYQDAGYYPMGTKDEPGWRNKMFVRAEIERLMCPEIQYSMEQLLSLLSDLEKECGDFPTTDEEMAKFLATHPKVEVPEKYKTPDWMFEKSENPMDQEGLEKEYEDYVVKDPCFSKLVNRNAGLVIARHFYELGCRRTAEKYDELEYNRQRAEDSEKPMNQEELEEEINRYLEPIYADDIQFEPFTQMTKCARHFAQWGAEHLKK